MFKYFARQFRTIGLSLMLLLAILICFPGAAQADKAPKAALFDPASTAINVIDVYETTPTTQKDIVSGVMKSSKAFFKKATGFNSFSVLQSNDGLRVVTLSQWQTPESYEAFITPPVEEETKSLKSSKGKKEKESVAPTRTLIFEIDQAQAPEGMIPGIRGDVTLVEFNEITAKAPEDLEQVLTSAESSLTGVTKVYPAPRSVILFKGVDSPELAIMADWGYSIDEFTDPTKFPTLAMDLDEITPIADTDQRLYQVVKVISAKPEKSKSEED
jgi:heme-degrading monooxygenase HmoA